MIEILSKMTEVGQYLTVITVSIIIMATTNFVFAKLVIILRGYPPNGKKPPTNKFDVAKAKVESHMYMHTTTTEKVDP